jgi:hypothetical protein
MKNSGLGIASFVLSILAGLLLFALVVSAGIMEATSPGGIDEKSPIAIALGLLILLLVGLDLVAAGLGIAGLFRKDRKRTLSILGLVFSGLTVFAMVLLMILGTVVA